MTPSTIVVYAGKGTKTANETLYSIKAEIDRNHHQIKFVEAADIRKGTILKETRLVVIPGGEDRYYDEELGRQGTDNIVTFAKDYSLLVFCAGMYGIGDGIRYHVGLPDEMIAPRMKILPGVVYSIDQQHGHVYDGTADTIFAAPVRLKNGLTFDAYCHGGCAFEPSPGYECGLFGGRLMAEARYDSLPGKPVAIARVNHGLERGVTIASGVHFEMPWPVVAHNLAGPKYAQLIAALEPGEKLRRMLMRSVLSQLKVRVKYDPSPIAALKNLSQLQSRPLVQPVCV